MLARSARKRSAADLVERRHQRACSGRGDIFLKRRKDALAIGLAERDEPHAGGDPVGRQRVQEGRQRRRAGDAMPGAGDADGDRQRDRSGPRGGKPVQRRARPCRARRIEKGAALRRRFEEALLGGREGRGKLGDGAQRCIVVGRDSRGGREQRTPHRKSRRLRASITASHPRSVSASLMSPASTAHSMPPE